MKKNKKKGDRGITRQKTGPVRKVISSGYFSLTTHTPSLAKKKNGCSCPSVVVIVYCSCFPAHFMPLFSPVMTQKKRQRVDDGRERGERVGGRRMRGK